VDCACPELKVYFVGRSTHSQACSSSGATRTNPTLTPLRCGTTACARLSPPPHPSPLITHRPLLSFLKQRYDARANMADWDYSMHLVSKAPLVNLREYVRWRCGCACWLHRGLTLCRNTGLAFDMREASYDVPNRTLASGLIVQGVGLVITSHGLTSPSSEGGQDCQARLLG
jgi:hypothetical protein